MSLITWLEAEARAKDRGQDHQGPRQQTRRVNDRVMMYAVEGQHTHRYPQQAQSFSTQAQ